MNDLTPDTTITGAYLREHSVCAGQAKTFAALWPRGLSCPTPRGRARVARRAVEAGLDIDWAAAQLLSWRALVVYDEATVTTHAVCIEARVPALAVYDEAKAAAWAVYDEATAAAFLAAWAGEE